MMEHPKPTIEEIKASLHEIAVGIWSDRSYTSPLVTAIVTGATGAAF